MPEQDTPAASQAASRLADLDVRQENHIGELRRLAREAAPQVMMALRDGAGGTWLTSAMRRSIETPLNILADGPLYMGLDELSATVRGSIMGACEDSRPLSSQEYAALDVATFYLPVACDDCGCLTINPLPRRTGSADWEHVCYRCAEDTITCSSCDTLTADGFWELDEVDDPICFSCSSRVDVNDVVATSPSITYLQPPPTRILPTSFINTERSTTMPDYRLRDYSTKIDHVYPADKMFLSGQRLPIPVPDRFLNAKPGHRLHIGIELEVEAREGRIEAVQRLGDLIGEHAFCKHDGSLNAERGFEICTIPATPVWHECYWPEKLTVMKEFLRGYHARGAGMHIHMAKSSFHRLGLGRFLAFFNANENHRFIADFAQRNYYEHNYCHANRNTKITDENKPQRHCHGSAVNIAPRPTVEVRIFRSNLDPEAFMRNIQFVVSLKEFCEWAGCKDLNAASYIKWMTLPANRVTYPNVWRRLARRHGGGLPSHGRSERQAAYLSAFVSDDNDTETAV